MTIDEVLNILPTNEELENKDIQIDEYPLFEIRNAIENFKNQHLYLMADFDNYRKRTLNEMTTAKNNEQKKIVLDILVFIDDMERLLDKINDENPTQNEIGFQMIYENFEKMLSSYGCKKIETNVGDEFDVEIHEAICSTPTDDGNLKNSISQIVQSGWMMNGKTIRHAKVGVYV